MSFLACLYFLNNYLVVSGAIFSATYPLDGSHWTLRESDSFADPIPATVPGTIYDALVAAGRIEDPYWRYNADTYAGCTLRGNNCTGDVSNMNWEYSASFRVPTGVHYSAVDLVAEGLDTIATVTLDGHVVGTADDMFRTWTWDVTALLGPRSGSSGLHTLTISFESAYTYASRLRTMDKDRYDTRAYIRKFSGAWGWDCVSPFYPSGVWKSVLLRFYLGAVLTDVATHIVPSVWPSVQLPRSFDVNVTVFISADSSGVANVVFRSGSTWFDLVKVHAEWRRGDNALTFVLPTATNVSLWWPSGYGSQPLYTLDAFLEEEASPLVDAELPGASAVVSKKVGFRSFEWVGIRGAAACDANSDVFFRINGRRIFSRGANWEGLTPFLTSNPATVELAVPWSRSYLGLRWILQSAIAANMNTLRVNGIGVVESEMFYTLCDELGLLVQQDGPFSQTNYPTDAPHIGPHLLTNVAIAAREAARRLSVHPSLVVWSGNNEQDANSNIALYVDAFLSTIVAEDRSIFRGGRDMVPASPSGGWKSTSPLVPQPKDCSIDTHFYNYARPCTMILDYIVPHVRFASEFGYMSYPSLDTWALFSAPADWGANSTFVRHRNRAAQAGYSTTSQILLQIGRYFPVPADITAAAAFSRFIYLSQITQLLCVEYESGFLRRSAGGAWYWSLNAIWPAPSWSAVEATGRWKPLQYGTKRFFAPVAITARFNLRLLKEQSVEAKLCASQPSQQSTNTVLSVHVSNERLTPLRCLGTLHVISWISGALRHTITFDVLVPPVSESARAGAYVYNSTVRDVLSASGCDLSGRDCLFLLAVHELASHTEFATTPGSRLLSSVPQALASNVFYPTTLKDSLLQPTVITADNFTLVSSGTVSFTIQSTAVTAYLVLRTPFLGTFSDNAFLLVPGVELIVQFNAAPGISVTPAQLRQMLSFECVNEMR